jgi:hypothetical protein
MKTKSTLFLLIVGILAVYCNQAMAQKGIGIRKSAFNNRRFYDHRRGFPSNSLRLHLFSLPSTIRLTYERTIFRRLALGINGSYQYGGDQAGSRKAEFYGKLFLSHGSPVGLYMQAMVGRGEILNHTFVYRMTETEGGQELEYDPNRPYVMEKKGSFSSNIGAIGLGFQNAVGLDKRIILDFGVGYQFFKVPADFKTPIVANQLVYGKFESNAKISGPISPFQGRFSIGFLF